VETGGGAAWLTGLRGRDCRDGFGRSRRLSRQRAGGPDQLVVLRDERDEGRRRCRVVDARKHVVERRPRLRSPTKIQYARQVARRVRAMSEGRLPLVRARLARWPAGLTPRSRRSPPDILRGAASGPGSMKARRRQSASRRFADRFFRTTAGRGNATLSSFQYCSWE